MRLKRIISLLMGVAAIPSGAAATGNSALLAELERTKFWLAEDYEQRDTLQAEIKKKGVASLFSSKRFVHLDAEALAEGGIMDVLLEIGPSLRQRGVTLHSFSQIQSDGYSYVVEVNGQRYTAYSDKDDLDSSWGLATETFFRVVNDILPQQSQDRFYAIYGGNDLFGFFLPPEIVPFFDSAGIDNTGIPYVPTREAPWFGMPES